MSAEQLAREIAEAIDNHVFPGDEQAVEKIIADRIKPVVKDAERWKRECDSVHSLANKLDARAGDADLYERWLLDIGRAIGCQHLDEQLPNCVIQHLQGDQESEVTHER